MIVTGSNDKIVRAWNPVVTTKPISLLSGHKAGLKNNLSNKFVKIICQKKIVKNIVKIIHQKICQTSRNQHQVTPINTKVKNSLDGEKRIVTLVLRNSACPASGRRA